MSIEVMGLLREIHEHLDQADERTKSRFTQVENSINDLFARAGRPGISTNDHQADITKSIEYCRTRRALTVPRTRAVWKLTTGPRTTNSARRASRARRYAISFVVATPTRRERAQKPEFIFTRQ